MKLILAMIIAIASIASSAKGTNTNSRIERMKARRAERMAMLASLTPEEREAMKKAARERANAERLAKRKAVAKANTEKYRKAKEACKDCYRVVVTNGVWVGMTKEQFDAYQKGKEENSVKMTAPRHRMGKRKRTDPIFARRKKLHNRRANSLRKEIEEIKAKRK